MDEDSDSDGEDPYEHPRNKRLLQLGRRLSNVSSDDDTASTLSIASSSEGGSPLSLASSASLPDIPSLDISLGPKPTAAFHAEASASLARAFEEDHAWQDALLELRTLVMGYNAGVDSARSEVVNAIIGAIDVSGGKSAVQVKTDAVKLWTKWGGMVDKLSEDMVEAVLVVQVGPRLARQDSLTL
jgi:translation initiation factor eIF-2B subunit epsilon